MEHSVARQCVRAPSSRTHGVPCRRVAVRAVRARDASTVPRRRGVCRREFAKEDHRRERAARTRHAGKRTLLFLTQAH
eukprot:4275540-Pleurochrysis_carterae.AAC.1